MSVKMVYYFKPVMEVAYRFLTKFALKVNFTLNLFYDWLANTIYLGGLCDMFKSYRTICGDTIL